MPKGRDFSAMEWKCPKVEIFLPWNSREGQKNLVPKLGITIEAWDEDFQVSKWQQATQWRKKKNPTQPKSRLALNKCQIKYFRSAQWIQVKQSCFKECSNISFFFLEKKKKKAEGKHFDRCISIQRKEEELIFSSWFGMKADGEISTPHHPPARIQNPKVQCKEWVK